MATFKVEKASWKAAFVSKTLLLLIATAHTSAVIAALLVGHMIASG